jgi:hypothetical protein
MAISILRAALWTVAAAAAGAAATAAPQVRDVEGRWLDLFAPSGAAGVLLFVTSDCPISNAYAPELQRICSDYRSGGIGCTLVYEDPAIDPAGVRTHAAEYALTGITAVIDADGTLAARTNATVTPQAIVVDPRGATRYSGRIDNLYAALGKRRPQATEFDLRNALDALLAGRDVRPERTEALGCYIERRK